MTEINALPHTISICNVPAHSGEISTRDATILGYTVEILVAMIASRQLLRTETNDALSDAVTAIDVIFETLDKHVRA